MRKIFLTGFWLFLLTLLFSPIVWAQNKIKLSEIPAVKPTIKLPTFMAGQNQLVIKTVDGDLMISGGQIRTTANVNGDAYVAGGQINIGGTISGNLIVAGGNITISGKVLKNVIVGGGEVNIEDTAEIGGYVLAGGGTVTLRGHFLGPVKVGGGTLIVGEKAVINGNLEADVSKSEVSPTSMVNGEKKINIHIAKQPEKEISQNQWRQLGYVREIFSFLSKLIILLIVVKLFGQKIKEINLKDSILMVSGLGFIFLILTPFLVFILMTTIIGIPLALMVLMTYLISLYSAGIVVSILIGDFIFKKKYLKTNNLYIQGMVGLLLLTIVGMIPLVGGLVKFIVLLLGLGVIFKCLQISFSKK